MRSKKNEPYIKPKMVSNEQNTDLRENIISQRQEERKIRRIQDEERKRVKEIKRITEMSVFGKILQPLPGNNDRRELLSFTRNPLDNNNPDPN